MRGCIARVGLVCLLMGVGLCTAQARSRVGYPRLMQLPMLGAVTTTSALIWVRASGPFEVRVDYSTEPRLAQAERSETIKVGKSEDYCATIRLGGLEPATRYYYRVRVDGDVARYYERVPPYSFRTAPSGPARFRVCFGSCAKVQYDPVQPIWGAVTELEPDLFFWLGDNIYGDALDPDILAEEYRRQREVPGFRPIGPNVPQLAVWDDHDFGLNNHDRTHPAKQPALDVFRRYWPNPAFGLPDAPGVFFSYSYGGVDFFFLDNRYHRDPNDAPPGPEKTCLGRLQRQWLLAGLKASTAPFKVLINGGGWNTGKGPDGDGWGAFLDERNAIFDFIRDHCIGGVLLLSGDTHTGELNVIPWSFREGYDYYELVASPLAQPANSHWPELKDREVRLNRPYNLSANAGVVDFDLTQDDPVVSLNLIDEYGRYVWKTTRVRAGELVNGVRSFPFK